jgi:hypothetical protein
MGPKQWDVDILADQLMHQTLVRLFGEPPEVEG